MTADLGDAPSTFTAKADGPVLAVTDESLLEISGAGAVKKLHGYHLGGLYPNSVVVADDGSVYIGMRFFVLQLVRTAKGYQEQWLIPNQCRKTRMVKWNCKCVEKEK